ncbi:MAG: ribonuclease H-like domain-containing protein [Synergistaceae bacterium]|jgi:uncharacterized protein YprB with RNaseH-like and TPR domain|nr:ribonuclease H-like domain-containing protein [Synergistaceae bacterium]
MGKFDRFFDDSDRQGAVPAKGEPPAVRGLPEGAWVDDGVYRVQSFHRLGAPHGQKVLSRPEEMGAMEAFGARGSVVFLDTETTGLSGGTGTYAFLCGIGFSSGDDFTVVQFFLEGPSKESRWLRAVDSAIPRDACLVTYNGASFDLPLLRTRHVLSRSTPAWDGAPHIDLLRHARKFYRGRLPSCSLGSMERNVLGVRRSGEDIPGSLIPGMYARYLHTRDASHLSGVFYHNEIDIVSLAALYCHVAHLMEGASSDGADLIRAGDLWAASGNPGRAEALWDRACEARQGRVEALLRKGFAAKRAQDRASARDAFQRALGALRDEPRRGADPTAYVLLEELAKLEEHAFKSREAAMRYTDMALEWLKRNRYILGASFTRMHQSMSRRAARLRRRFPDEG